MSSSSDVLEAAVLAEGYRVDHNLERLRSSLGYLTPAEFAVRAPLVPLPPKGWGSA